MTTDQTPAEPGDAEKPRRTLAEAALELRALMRAQRARTQAERGEANRVPNADLLDQLGRLERDVERRRAAAEKAGLTGD